MEICFFKTTFGLKFFTSSFNWRLFWIPDISRQPIIFHNNSISTFDRHVKLYSSTKFHAFNQNSHNPCTYICPTIGLDWQKNNFAREIGFYGHFLAIVTRLRHETYYQNLISCACFRVGKHNTKFSFPF